MITNVTPLGLSNVVLTDSIVTKLDSIEAFKNKGFKRYLISFDSKRLL